VPTFSYVAVDARGRTRRGIIEAEASRQARSELRNAGLLPVELVEAGPEETSAGSSRWFGARARIPYAELVLITRRFALLLEAGLTIGQALEALIEQTQHEPTRRTLAAVRSEVVAGHSLAAALGRHPSSFSDLYRVLVGTGEQSGELATVMVRIADHLEARQAVRQGAGLALLYPAIVATVALLIVAGLLTYVVPQVVQVFEQSRQSLPMLTRAMLWTSELLRGKLVIIGMAIFAIAAFLRAAYRREEARAKWHALLLRVPVLGPLAQGIETARLASTLAILVSSGVPLLQALAAGAQVVSNLPMRRTVEFALQRVREGGSLHRALGNRGAFPPILIHLIASGEASGRLGYMLECAARHQQAENETRIRLLAGIVEPAVIVVTGVAVLLVVLAILLPIIEMNSLLRL